MSAPGKGKDMDYKLYLFDFDYTLADSEEAIVSCYKHVFNLHGFQIPPDDDIRRTIGYTLAEGFEMLLGERDPETLERYRVEYVDRANEIMAKMTKLYPTVPPTIRTLHDRGALLGVISIKYRFRLSITLEEYGILDLFSVIIGGEDVTAAKPDPQGILKALDVMKVAKNDVLYIGDSVVDARTAENAGVDFAPVTTGMTRAEEFAPYRCVRILSDLSELV